MIIAYGFLVSLNRMEAGRVRPYVDRYLRERRGGAVEAQLAKITAPLDAVFWEEVELRTAMAARSHSERLVFDKESRLLLDLGLVDWRFFEGGEKNRGELLRELYAPSVPNQFYFSEWLAHRFRSFVLMSRVSRPEAPPQAGSASVREARSRLYASLRALFQSLPGFPPQAVDLFLSGRLDETMDELSRRGDEARAVEQRRQLSDIRGRLVSRARERARNDVDLALFDALGQLDREAEKAGGTEEAPFSADGTSPNEEERIEFVRAEVRLVRSLLRLGATGSGLARTHSVLVALEPRLSRTDLAPLLALVREADAGLPTPPTIVIAPYVGTGFYEWDRDSVFVPIRSTRSPQESVATALASFRIMLDALQQNGALRRAYQERLKAPDFHEAFVRDYHGWVLGVARGYRGALAPEEFAFFQERIGPRPDDLYAPKEWVSLTPEERARTIRECRSRVGRSEAGYQDHYRLAVAYVREGMAEAALNELHEAVRLHPIDGRVLLARAWLLRESGDREGSREQCHEIVDLCPNTIWSVYASDQLAH